MRKVISVLILSCIVGIVGGILILGQMKGDSCLLGVKEENCFICEYSKNNLMQSQNGTQIGLFCLTSFKVVNIGDWDELNKETAGFIYYSCGDNECSFTISSIRGRRIFDIQINYGERRQPDLDMMKEALCQKCFNKIAEMCEKEMVNGKSGFLEVCLVDLTSSEFYSLGSAFLSYPMGDYWVHIDHKGDRDNILIFYAPFYK